MERFIKFLDSGLVSTCAHTYGFRPKYFIEAALGGAIALGSTIFGGIKSAQANKRAREEAAAQKARDDAWYQRRYNEDYADTAAGQNLIRHAKDYAAENWKKAQGSAAVGGGTDAATAMAKEAGNKVVGNTIANMAAADTARKDNIDAQHRQDEKAYSAQQQQFAQNDANNISQVASGFSNAAMSTAAALGSNSASTASNVKGSTGSNASAPTNGVHVVEYGNDPVLGKVPTILGK